MPETEHSQLNLAAIRTRLDNLDAMMRFSLASRAESREHVLRILKGRAGAAECYLALGDGPKSQPQLEQILKKSQATVSRILTYLEKDEGLIASHKDPTVKGGLLFSWHDIERVVGVSRIARECVK